MTSVVADYRTILQDFLSGKISASAFEALYLEKFKGETRGMSDAVFLTLDELFGDVDSFTSDPNLRAANPEFYINEDQLIECAKRALNQLI